MRAVIFEDDTALNFAPLTLTRPAFELTLGTKSLLQNLVETLGLSDYTLKVRPYLEGITKQRCRREINPSRTEENMLLFINGLLNPTQQVAALIKQDEAFAAFTGDHLVAARLNHKDADKMLQSKTIGENLKTLSSLKRIDLPESLLIRYPWQLIERNPDAIKHQAESFPNGDDSPSLDGCFVLGQRKNLLFEGNAKVEPSVTFDVRGGPIIIGEDAEIRSFTRVEGPVYIGRRAQIRSARVSGGTSIGDQCRVGGEVEATIIDHCSNKAHDGFIGHSYIGEWVNIGAGTSNSDLKNTYGTIRMSLGSARVDTGSIKVGCFVGDYAKTSIGCFIYTGRRIGVSSQIHGYITEDVPSFTIYAKNISGKNFELKLDSASETQRRMMMRRGAEQTEQDKSLLSAIFEATQRERYLSGVLKSDFIL